MLAEVKYLRIAAPRGLVEEVGVVAIAVIPAILWPKTGQQFPLLEK